jgi:hypothetical protein
MAKKLGSFKRSENPGSSKYPWDEWLDGSVWELTSGEDFAVSLFSFRTAAYGAAAARGLRVRTSVQRNALVIQAYRKDSA